MFKRLINRRKLSSHRINRARRMLFEPLEDRRLLTLYVVTSLEDGITDGDGKLTLREALLGAETNLPSGDAIAGSATEIDEIRFGPQAFAGGL
ncbi:MAG TPA: hypothetical protein P5307_20670, partial [Pirellulaceae bacterium]|nr:hypothetical protein [Pirellulaceae bacterium]